MRNPAEKRGFLFLYFTLIDILILMVARMRVTSFWERQVVGSNPIILRGVAQLVER